MTPASAADAGPLETLAAQVPDQLDLTEADHLAAVTRGAERLLDAHDEPALLALEHAGAERGDGLPLGAHLAIKLALGKRRLADLSGPRHLSVVFAVYQEHTRIVARRQHEHGEDFLRRKVAQLAWLFDGVEGGGWDLTIVDDGCPDGSGHLARRIVDEEGLGDRVSVLFLRDAIDEGLPVSRGLATPDDSRKGGSILYGMWAATRTERPGHVVLYTDADLSTHLGQSGLAMAPILAGGRDLAIGSRREPLSIAVKKGRRNVRGKLFIYLWKRLLPVLDEVVDTQCGFKAFSGDAVRALVEGIAEKGFAFDIELLLAGRLAGLDIERIPIAWIDSEAASTTTAIQPYLTMLTAVVRMARTYLPPEARAEAFGALIESLDEDSWQRLVDAVPPELADGDPAEFGTWAGFDADAMRAWLD